MASSIQSFTGNLVAKPSASDLLLRNGGFCGVPIKKAAQLGAKSTRDLTVLAKIKRVRKHEYPWPRNPDPNAEGGALMHLSHFKPLKDKPKPVTLEFEKPLLELEKTMNDVQKMMKETGLDMSENLKVLEKKYQEKLKDLYTSLTPIQRVHIARHPNRPTFLDHVFSITEKFLEIHGDRAGYDDPAIVTGLGTINGRTYMFIGHQKGRHTKENIMRNFGMPTPHGYRKALRMMEYADHYGFPIITFVDTPGAFADIKSEELGQGEAIAHNLESMFGLKVPMVTVIIGEGGSGGALAIACPNKVLMLENAVFYVASPEACAAILFKTAKAAPKAAKLLKITATKLMELKFADVVIPEPLGGAHANPEWTSQQIKAAIVESMDELLAMDTETLLKHRAQKFRQFGRATTGLNIDPKKKINMKRTEVPPSDVELRNKVDKLRQQYMEASKTSSPLPMTGLKKALRMLNQAIAYDYVKAAKDLGVHEQYFAREKVEDAKNLKENLDQFKREYQRKIPLTPNYYSLKSKLDMVRQLKDTAYIVRLNNPNKLKLRSSEVKEQAESLLKELTKPGFAPDERTKAKIRALRAQTQQGIKNLKELLAKKQPKAVPKVTKQLSAGGTAVEPSENDVEVLEDETSHPVISVET